MRKAQTEIIGLLVIVILFIFVGLIYVMLTGKSDDESLTRDVVHTGKVQNFLDAFVQVTPCYTKIPFEQMSTVIKNCYISDGEESICGKNCKDLITDTLEAAMEEYNAKQEYEFKIISADEEEFISIGGCTDTISTPTATERIIAGQAITLRMTYCMK